MIGKLPFGNLCDLYGLKNLAACEALPHVRTYGECARCFGSLINADDRQLV